MAHHTNWTDERIKATKSDLSTMWEGETAPTVLTDYATRQLMSALAEIERLNQLVGFSKQSAA